MTIYEKTVAYVDDAYKGKQKLHFERAVYWFEQLMPDCTEAHKVAAYAHDIERAFRPADKKEPDDYLDQDFLKYHQDKGAEIMQEFLTKEGQSEEFIETVVHVISRHEFGGDDVQNTMMDADSVSFFETNAEIFVNKKAPVEGYEKVKRKLEWMFERIVSEKAKSAARENYERFIREFEKSKKLLNFSGEEVVFIETSQVKEGVICDVYNFTNDNSKDLGIVKVKKGFKTPLQKVLSGDKTLEIFRHGKGTLTVIDARGCKITHNFPSDNKEVEINIGEIMQWEALEDLTFAEICYPPYQDGRFENIM